MTPMTKSTKWFLGILAFLALLAVGFILLLVSLFNTSGEGTETYTSGGGERIGVDTVLQLIVDAAREVIPNTQRVVLHLLDNERKFLVPRAVAGYSEAPTIRMNIKTSTAANAVPRSRNTSIVICHSPSHFIDGS